MKVVHQALAVAAVTLGGCGLFGEAEVGEPEVEAWVLEQKVPSGAAVRVAVARDLEPGWSVDVGVPLAEGLEVKGVDGPATAGREVAWYALSGPDGSYQVQLPPATLRAPDGSEESVELGPFFVDIGVSGPSGGTLAELEAPVPEPGLPWAWIIAALVAVALVIGLASAWLLRRPEEKAGPPPLSAVEQAARDWAAARGQGHADHSLAIALSMVFRVYLEQSSGWPATRRTGLEILDWVRDTGRLGPGDEARAARILQATDRLKFAREGGGAEFFDSLDRDFEGILAADRLSAPPLEHDTDPDAHQLNSPGAVTGSADVDGSEVNRA